MSLGVLAGVSPVHAKAPSASPVTNPVSYGTKIGPKAQAGAHRGTGVSPPGRPRYGGGFRMRPVKSGLVGGT